LSGWRNAESLLLRRGLKGPAARSGSHPTGASVFVEREAVWPLTRKGRRQTGWYQRPFGVERRSDLPAEGESQPEAERTGAEKQKCVPATGRPHFPPG